MLVRSWRLATILFTALSLTPALAHLLEMPAKLGYDGRLWLTLQQSLYGPGFGTVGAFCEVGAVVTTVVLAILVRNAAPRSAGPSSEPCAWWPRTPLSGSGLRRSTR